MNENINKMLFKGNINPAHKKCAIIMPAHNEDKILPATIDHYHRAAVKISGLLVIINDGSTDKTKLILEDSVQRYSQLICIHKENEGHGRTCIQGYKWAVAEGFEWIFQIDSDGQTSMQDFLDAWNVKDNHNFIFGNRVDRKDSLFRKIISKILKFIIKIIFHVDVPDANVLFRLMRSQSLIPFVRHIPSYLVSSNIYLTILLQKSSHKILWKVVSFKRRRVGKQSVTIFQIVSVGIKTITELVRMRKCIHQPIG